MSEIHKPSVRTVERTEDRFLPSDVFESRSRNQPPRNGTGVDMDRWIEFRTTEREQFAEFMRLGRARLGFFQSPYVSWRKDIALYLGPQAAAQRGLVVST